MKKKLLIGFSGKRGVGKTQASMYLYRKYGFKTVSFGSGLREMAKEFFPFEPADFSEKFKEKPYKKYDWTPRDFMISLGALARFYDENYWVNKAGLKDYDVDVSVDDVRFPNEAEHIKSLGGKMIRIERSEKLNVYGKNLDIESETALDNYADFDYTIDACWNVKLEDLHKKLDDAIKQFRS